MNDDGLINICQFTPVFIALMNAMSEGHENGSLYGCKSPFTLSLQHADRDTAIWSLTGQMVSATGQISGIRTPLLLSWFRNQPVLNWANVCSRT